MRKRKFGTGGLNALDMPRDQSGASSTAPPQIVQAPAPSPGQTPLYPAPTATFPRAGFKKGGNIKSKGAKSMSKKAAPAKFAKGGSVRSGIDGIAKKGHTKGKDIKMAKGGKC